MPDYRTDRVRLIVLIYRKAGMSVQDFQDHWRNKHANVVSNVDVVKRNLLKYEQVHHNELSLGKLKTLGFNVPEFDGMSILEASSYNKIMDCFTDEEYKRAVIVDEEKFLDRKRTIAVPADFVEVLV